MTSDPSSAASVRVPWKVRIAYALPALALSVVGIPVYVYLPKFYTDVVGVSASAVGVILLGVRLFDAVTDPLEGFISDRMSTPFGRRKPFILGASVPLAALIYFLFVPPAMVPESGMWWFGLSISGLFLFWTLITVPYEALGAEITSDYDERTALLGMRDGVLLLGTLVAASSPVLISRLLDLPSDSDGERAKFFWIGLIYAPLVVAACLGCVLFVPEKEDARRPKSWNPFREFSTTLGNRPFMILLLSYTISALGSNLPATLILYYVEYVLQSQKADAFLLLYFVTGIVFLPGWIALSRRVGKKEAWLSSMAVNTGAFVGVFFLGPGDEIWYGLLVFLSGIGLGGVLAIPPSMQADVIDYDESLTGERREGHYIGVWSVARKLAAALGVGLALFLLGQSGYAPGVEQPPDVVLTLRVLYALVPSLCNIAAFLVALAYPISRERHEAILAAARNRRSG